MPAPGAAGSCRRGIFLLWTLLRNTKAQDSVGVWARRRINRGLAAQPPSEDRALFSPALETQPWAAAAALQLGKTSSSTSRTALHRPGSQSCSSGLYLFIYLFG